jgi:polyphosphate kinase 2 (PPK2 family)
MRRLPERGRIGIFNRSYYEEVLVVRVHAGNSAVSADARQLENDRNILEKRFAQIRNFET